MQGMATSTVQRERVADRPVILALDLGTSTGWAIRMADGCKVSGRSSFRPGRHEGAGMRYLRFLRWLADLYSAAGQIRAVYYEEVRHHAGVDAAHCYGGLLSHLQAWCEERGIPYQGAPVGTIKKHATGRGNAKKAEMIESAKLRGFEIPPGDGDDDEADAACILEWALAEGPVR